jgi:hypothetical protein
MNSLLPLPIAALGARRRWRTRCTVPPPSYVRRSTVSCSRGEQDERALDEVPCAPGGGSHRVLTTPRHATPRHATPRHAARTRPAGPDRPFGGEPDGAPCSFSAHPLAFATGSVNLCPQLTSAVWFAPRRFAALPPAPHPKSPQTQPSLSGHPQSMHSIPSAPRVWTSRLALVTICITRGACLASGPPTQPCRRRRSVCAITCHDLPSRTTMHRHAPSCTIGITRWITGRRRQAPSARCAIRQQFPFLARHPPLDEGDLSSRDTPRLASRSYPPGGASELHSPYSPGIIDDPANDDPANDDPANDTHMRPIRSGARPVLL